MDVHYEQKGFGLLEMLLVIAIFGILTTLVLVSVSSARGKARDTRIRQNIVQLRYLAEIAYDSQGASYVGWTALPEIQTSKTTLLTDIGENQEGPVVAALRDTQEDNFCISASLNTDPAQHYCVDASGELKTTTGACPDDPTPDEDDNPLLECPTS